MKASLIILSLFSALAVASPEPTFWKWKEGKECAAKNCHPPHYEGTEYQKCVQKNEFEYYCKHKCPYYKPDIKWCKKSKWHRDVDAPVDSPEE